jgi:CRP-like cAMP-binding protein
MVLETISSLKVPAKIREYRKSEVIFDEGTTGVEMYIVYSGKVRLSTKEPGREITRTARSSSCWIRKSFGRSYASIPSLP